FAYCYGDSGHLPDRLINSRIFRPDNVLYKIRIQLLKGLTYFDAVRQVKPCMQINGPVTHSPNGLINSFAVRDGFVDMLIKIKGLVAIPSCWTDPVGSQASLYTISGSLFLCFGFGGTEARRITFDVIPGGPSQQFIDRHTQCLAFDIPQSHFQGSQGMEFFPSRGIKHSPIYILPEMLNPERILPNHHLGTLLDHVLGSAFTDPDDSPIGFNFNNSPGLIKKRLVVAWSTVIPNLSYFHP